MDPIQSDPTDPERCARLALWSIRGLSSRSIAAAAAAFGSTLAACRAPREALADALDLGAGARARLLAASEDLVALGAALRAQVAARGGRFLLRGEEGYPDFGGLVDPPEALWVRGDLAGAGGTGADGLPPAVAVVGARKADPGAIHLARRFGASLAAAGYTVVSGGALGVDAAAHDGANEAGGATLAVLGSGLLRPLPARNRRLFGRMLAGKGGLASELPPLEGARAEHFPRRNRLIAALARAVVVVRAAAGSGSLYTARAAVSLGRPVFVVPAPDLGPAAAGGEALLAEGAAAVRSVEELLPALRGEAVNAAPAKGSDAVLDALGLLPASVVEVAAAAGLDQAEVARRLAALCAKGLVRPAGPGRFLRAPH
ncbi:MAG TPA: DNA-processing protein DprA [Vulgatibacter sp.]|nr:DNA-processing protein DprA [Vulgatibacter sp.]